MNHMNNKKLVIGISLRIVNAEAYPEKRDVLSQDWPKLFEKLNYFPLLIPNSIESVSEFLDEMNVSGLVLSGGDNLGDDKTRDLTEIEIINYAISNKIPLIGICRGMQALNNFFGGSLQKRDDPEHIKNNHIINLSKDFSFNNNNSMTVNSFHNNIIESEDLGKDLKSFAAHEGDNTIEGFVHTNHPIIGIMWHPERNPDNNSIQLFQKIFSKINE